MSLAVGGTIACNQTISCPSLSTNSLYSVNPTDSVFLYSATSGAITVGTSTTSTTWNGNFTVSGNVTATTFNATSDYRLKSNVLSLGEQDTVQFLNPVYYTLNGTQSRGFIAHEVQEKFPDLVTGEKDGEQWQSLNYIGLIPIIVKDIQRLHLENQKLRDQLDSLTAAFAALTTAE